MLPPVRVFPELGKMASYMLWGDGKNKGRRNTAATGAFITSLPCNFRGEARAVGALEKE